MGAVSAKSVNPDVEIMNSMLDLANVELARASKWMLDVIEKEGCEELKKAGPAVSTDQLPGCRECAVA
jgi:hypothetical protein